MANLKHSVPDRNMPDTNRRAELRHRAFKGARLMFNNGFSVYEALARDISEHGARLKLGDPSTVPSHCMVEISGEPRVYFARIAWRGGTEVGVQLS